MFLASSSHFLPKLFVFLVTENCLADLGPLVSSMICCVWQENLVQVDDWLGKVDGRSRWLLIMIEIGIDNDRPGNQRRPGVVIHWQVMN